MRTRARIKGGSESPESKFLSVRALDQPRCNRCASAGVLTGMGAHLPRRRTERRGLRLWPVGTVLILTFTSALLVAAAVFATGWELLGARGLKPEHRIDSKTLFDLVKLAFGVVAGAGALVALVVAYRRQRVDEDGTARVVRAPRLVHLIPPVRCEGGSPQGLARTRARIKGGSRKSRNSAAPRCGPLPYATIAACRRRRFSSCAQSPALCRCRRAVAEYIAPPRSRWWWVTPPPSAFSASGSASRTRTGSLRYCPRPSASFRRRAPGAGPGEPTGPEEIAEPE
ncbi:hypothetical protein QF027_000087 [Streptomyces canus]|nr:hypothetical protein [Streptomyces canus]